MFREMRKSFMFFLLAMSARAEYENSCETLSSEIHLVKVDHKMQNVCCKCNVVFLSRRSTLRGRSW